MIDLSRSDFGDGAKSDLTVTMMPGRREYFSISRLRRKGNRTGSAGYCQVMWNWR